MSTPITNNSVELRSSSSAPAWIQSISLAIIATILLVSFMFFGLKYLQLKSAVENFGNEPSSSSSCTPEDGLLDC